MTPEKIDKLMKKMRVNRAKMTNWKLNLKERRVARTRYKHAINDLTK